MDRESIRLLDELQQGDRVALRLSDGERVEGNIAYETVFRKSISGGAAWFIALTWEVGDSSLAASYDTRDIVRIFDLRNGVKE